jgi:hypothetical protein
MRDVGVVETRQHPCLTLETDQSVLVPGQIRGQDLDGDLATEPGVLGAPDLAHPPGAELRHDPISRDRPVNLKQPVLLFQSRMRLYMRANAEPVRDILGPVP